MPHAPPAKKSTAFQWLGALVLAGVVIAFAIRQYQFVDRYALNIMFSDQWDLYQPIFDHRGGWALFTFQHGPHRQGVGFLITPLLARISGCNTRWDSFVVSYTMMAACILGLFLSYLCGVRQPLAMLAVPMMYLTAREYESFTAASNLSHGAMPMLLFTALCLAWFIRNHATRIAIISLLTFGLIFTGFGIFVGLLTPITFVIEGVQALRKKQRAHAGLTLAGLIACGISWVLFSIGYVFDPAVPGFVFPWPRPLEYFGFVAQMLSNFYGAADRNPLSVPIGLFIMVFLIFICLQHARRLILRGILNDRVATVMFLLSAFALLYCFNTAIGRVPINWKTAPLASRYVILMIPAGMAIFLQLATARRRFLAMALAIIYAILVVPGAWQLSDDDWNIIHVLHDNRRLAWRNAYFLTHDQTKANDMVEFAVYPRPEEIEGRLKFMQIHRLNFFQDEPPH